MTPYRLYHSIRLRLIKSKAKRAEYLKKHNILGAIGENCMWGPWLLPVYPKLIRLHNNVFVHKNVRLVPHDMVNRFLKTVYPGADFGNNETLGCIEIMDNVYISTAARINANVRIGKNCIITAGSVVTSDIPENSVVAGVPAKPIGSFEMFAALRKMKNKQTSKFKNQHLNQEIIDAEWEKFDKRHNNKS